MILRRRALDVDVRVRVEDPVLARTVDQLLGDLSPSPRTGSPDHDITVSGSGPWSVRTAGLVHRAVTREQALTRTLAAVNLAAVTDTPLLAFHAAVVSRAGHSLVVPARSGSGKSTLTAALLQRGWDYVSDEALALEWSTGELVSYPRPLALSPWSLAAVHAPPGHWADGETLLRASHLGAAVERSPGPVRQVVLLERSSDVGDTAVSEVDRNEALVELLARGFTHRHDGGRALVVLAALLRGAEVLRLRLGHPVDAAALLTSACDAA